MMYGYGYGPDFGLYHLLNFIVWIVIIVFLVGFLRRKAWKNRDWHPWRSSALDILRERFAKGEISKEEYEERKKVLTEEK